MRERPFKLLYPTLACANASLGFFFFNYNLSVFNTLITYMQKYVFPDASKDIIVFVASAPIITAAIAALFAGYLAARLGRRVLMISSDIIAIIGVILTLIASLPVVIVGRLLIGINLGITTVAVPLYFTEVPPPEYRGPLSIGPPLLGSSGILLAFCLGLTVPETVAPGDEGKNQAWRVLQAVSILMVLVRSINLLLVFRYDTAQYLISQNKMEAAKKALSKYYKESYVSTRAQELLQEKNYVQSQGKVRLADLGKKKYRKALLVAIVMMVFQHLSGLNIIMVYCKTIYGAGISDPNSPIPKYFPIIMAVIMISSSFGLIYVVQRFKRKQLLVLGTLAVGAIELIFALISIISSEGNLAAKIVLLFWPIPFVWSLGSIIFIMVPETLPEIGVSIALLTNWISGFVTVQFFPNVAQSIGIGWTFFIIAILTICVGFLFSFVAVETKGKDKEDILREYNGDARISISTEASEPVKFNESEGSPVAKINFQETFEA